MSDEVPWPRLGDVLFSNDGGWYNACVGWTHDQWFGYAEGYRLAADILVQHVFDTQRDQDFLIYPIVFSYRQAVEVSLKHLIWIGSQLLDREAELPIHHKLVPLWQRCRPILEQVWPNGPKQDLDAVGAVLGQFEARDPTSTVFRYPVTKEGRSSLPVSEHIDIRNFAEVANRIFSLLDACASGLREHLQNKCDMEREYAG